MKKGKLLVISGFSGVGKGTVVKYLKEHKDTYKVSVSEQQENQDQMKSQEFIIIIFQMNSLKR